MIPELTQRALAGEPVASAALEDALHVVMEGRADPVQFAGLLVALAARPVEPAWLAAGARVLRARCVPIESRRRPLIDTCGTGGDGAGSFNVSTAVAMVVAAAGGAVAKHGNRGVSSKVGSADVLEASGCFLELEPREAAQLLDETGFMFLYAPAHHPAMRHVGPIRRSLGIRTLFNLLGPLANPALAERQLVGVYDPYLTKVMAEALRELGSEHAIVVHCDGLDEIGLHAVTRGHRVRDGAVEPFELDPTTLGIARAAPGSLAGGDAARNVELMRQSLAGTAGPVSDVVALNAGVALTLLELAHDPADGLEQARALMHEGKPTAVFEDYQRRTRQIASERPS